MHRKRTPSPAGRRARLFALVLVCASHAAAQNRTEVVIDGLADAGLRSRIEQNASDVLTALNVAFHEQRDPLLPRSLVTEGGRRAIETLWASDPFHCPDTRVEAHLVRRTGIDGGYEIRGLRLFVRDAEPEAHEEGVLLLSPSGLVHGLYFGLDYERYRGLIALQDTVREYRHRQVILDFLENFRTAYVRRDLAFLGEVFSEHALIIVGRIVERDEEPARGLEPGRILELSLPPQQVEYVRRSKREYLDRLRPIFARSQYLRVEFREIEIYRHPRFPEIFGVTLQQSWRSSGYEDVGWLFVMIDFKDELRPLIHVRTWQPGAYVPREDVFGLGDFEIIN